MPPRIEKAQLIPVADDGTPQTGEAILVQFNPESLKVTLSNTLQTENSGGGQASAAQYVDKSESSLTVQLWFDTTVARPQAGEAGAAAAGSETQSAGASGTQSAGSGAGAAGGEGEGDPQLRLRHAPNTDVRKITRLIADAFMKPRPATDDNGPRAPRKCRFQWGSFAFVGLVSSFDETVDFFAPEGVPLRAMVSLGLKEDRYQFENLPARVGDRQNPSFSPGGDAAPVAQAASNAGGDPRNWRNAALFNGIESPRAALEAGLSLPGASITAEVSAGGALTATVAGFSAGASASLGTDIPGAFNASLSLPGLSASASLPGVTASAGGGGLSARASLGGFSASASAGGGLSAGLSASASGGLSASASLGGGASGGRFLTASAMAAGGVGAADVDVGGGLASATASVSGGEASFTASGGGLASGSASASLGGGSASATADFDFQTG